MKKFSLIFITLSSIVFLNIVSTTVFADTTETGNSPVMQVAPVIEELKLEPSENKERSFSVTNIGDRELNIRVYAAPYSFSNKTGTSDFETQSEFTQIYHWIKIQDSDSNLKDEAKFTISPNKSKTINYQIDVPDSAPGGSQHACLFVEAIPENENPNSITTVSRMAIKIFADVSGETIKDAEIISLNTGTFILDGKVSASATVKNIGNIDVKPTLSVEINSLGGETVFSDTGIAMIFPGNEASITVDWPSTPAFGIYNLVASVNVLGKNSIIRKTIFIIPRWFIVLLLIIIPIATMLICRSCRNRRIRKLNSRRYNQGKSLEKNHKN